MNFTQLSVWLYRFNKSLNKAITARNLSESAAFAIKKAGKAIHRPGYSIEKRIFKNA